MMQSPLIHTLQSLLDESLGLQLAAKEAHWNLRGPWFIARHELFDRVAAHMRSHADDLAERIGALGAAAQATPTRAPERETHRLMSGEDMLRKLVRRMDALSVSLQSGASLAEAAGDRATEDLLTGQLRAVERDAWFLRSHLRPDQTPAPVEALQVPSDEDPQGAKVAVPRAREEAVAVEIVS